MDPFPITERSRVRRAAPRAAYERETVYRIIDEALICHVGFLVDGEPRVLPTAIARLGDAVYIHGSRRSLLIRSTEAGQPACLTVTHLDGLVVARSAFHCSMNYRSVVIHARGRKVTGRRKVALLDALTERLLPGHGASFRAHKPKELAATAIVEFPLEEASAKLRSGPPADDEEDYARPVWAGVVPLALRAGRPQPDPRLAAGIEVPPYLRRYRRR